MTEFTKGPWVFYRDLPTDVVVSQSGECSLATLDCGCGDRKTQRANAHLIAAAPDLYEALDRLVGEIKDYHVSSSVLDAIEASIYAIAKARGEA